METLQPPTDNLYKFVAIGGLAVALLCMFFVFREQAALRDKWIDAQVELISGGYQEGTGMPADSELRKAYFRREYARVEAGNLMKFLHSHIGHTMGISLGVSILGFMAWWFRVQQYDDVILRTTAAKLKREECAAVAVPSTEQA